MQLIDIKAEAVWIEGDFADGYGTIQRGGDAGRQDVPEDHREDEEAEDSIDDDYREERDADSAHAAGLEEGRDAAHPGVHRSTLALKRSIIGVAGRRSRTLEARASPAL